ncbi:AbrB/MazE/SpoVT family DNA-binding domain-containing protein [Neomoorella mulderi]|uniref:SpoVT / AbrB like domain protein n=1 Tax=Moorella mulderi DSM 14980 TaxID=1122241 RepID=A0A151AY13_9FIRM|nr:AbrB/MazE/SpoVT family DNA-binding domain-containing protein [Moorella mulderi]KYH32538.1 SpoVT / AbrB like domain protein [Moorella mulderi DSM 14980]
MPTVKISAKGQVVIPAHLRQKYGLQARGRAIITEKEGQIIITPAPADPVRGARGMLKAKQSLTKTHAAYKREERKLEEDHERQLP